MNDTIKPEWFLVAIMLVPCVIGTFLAYHRGRSIVGWGVICALFPVFLLVIYFHKPLREVRGGFKRCGACREFIKWGEKVCRYCAAPQPPRG